MTFSLDEPVHFGRPNTVCGYRKASNALYRTTRTSGKTTPQIRRHRYQRPELDSLSRQLRLQFCCLVTHKTKIFPVFRSSTYDDFESRKMSMCPSGVRLVRERCVLVWPERCRSHTRPFMTGNPASLTKKSEPSNAGDEFRTREPSVLSAMPRSSASSTTSFDV